MAKPDRWLKCIAERLVTARVAAGLSQQAIADELGVSKQLVSAWEHGRNEPRARELAKLVPHLHLDYRGLLEGEGPLWSPSDGVRLVHKLTPETIIGYAKRGVFDSECGSGAFLDSALLAMKRPGPGRKKKSTESGQSQYRQMQAFICAIIGSISKSAFAMAALDRGLEPRIEINDLVAIDPDRSPEPGDVVLVVLLKTEELLLRRFRPRLGIAPPFTLGATNPDYPAAREVTKTDRPVLVGTKVQHMSLGTR